MTREEFEKQLDGMAFNGENLGKFLRENYTLSEPTKTEPTAITEEMTNGIDEGIRCAMCTNPMANNRGCDGMCKVDKTMYRKVLDVINNTLYKGNFTMPTRPKAKWIERDLESYNPITRDRKIYVCSNCHLGIDSSVNRFANYCPNCGAEMESE